MCVCVCVRHVIISGHNINELWVSIQNSLKATILAPACYPLSLHLIITCPLGHSPVTLNSWKFPEPHGFIFHACVPATLLPYLFGKHLLVLQDSVLLHKASFDPASPKTFLPHSKDPFSLSEDVNLGRSFLSLLFASRTPAPPRVLRPAPYRTCLTPPCMPPTHHLFLECCFVTLAK